MRVLDLDHESNEQNFDYFPNQKSLFSIKSNRQQIKTEEFRRLFTRRGVAMEIYRNNLLRFANISQRSRNTRSLNVDALYDSLSIGFVASKKGYSRHKCIYMFHLILRIWKVFFPSVLLINKLLVSKGSIYNWLINFEQNVPATCKLLDSTHYLYECNFDCKICYLQNELYKLGNDFDFL